MIIMSLTLAGDLDQEEGALHEHEDALDVEVALGVEDGHEAGEDAEDGVHVGAEHGDAAQEVVQLVRLVVGVGQLLDLHEGPDTRHDGEGEDDDLGAVVDPEHLPAELLAVLHHEEDDDDDDSAHKAQEAQEKS